jgi:predicted dienelactone hydrolase
MSFHQVSFPQIFLVAVFTVGIVGCGSSPSAPPPPISVAVSPASATIQASGTQQFKATVSNDSANKGVTWTLSCSTPPCGSLSPTSTASGAVTTYTAPSTPPISDSAVTVTATSAADTLISNMATLTVSGLILSINPPSLNVNAGASAPVTATVANDPANQGVTWTVTCDTAPCGTVAPTSTKSGAATTYTAPTGIPAFDTQVTVTATAVANTQVVVSSSITIPGVDVSVDPGSATVIAGATAQFTANLVNDPQNQGVTWSLSCSPTPCGTILPAASTSGVPVTYTAPPAAPESDLPVTLTATSVYNSAATSAALITVPAITVSATPKSALIPLNISQTFTAIVGNDPASKGVNWTLTQNGTACSPGCGKMTPLSTDSGTAATYTAPGSMSASAVTVTATAISDGTKSDTATVTLSTGTVKLVPTSLDFGTHTVGQPSTAQTVVLTNTGLSALTVSSVAVVGVSDYALTAANPCGNSVTAGSTCSISVIFTPKQRGPRAANLVITDSSTDSPQQVALSGTGFSICTAQIKETLSAAPVRTALGTFGTVTVPAPSGSNSVGTRLIHMVDSTRVDPFLENGQRRELMVRFWYPASLDHCCKPAEYTSAAVWSYFSQLLQLPLPAVVTNSCLEAPVAPGTHPVVVFSHGYTGTFTDYTFLFEDLASRGYVVASVDHTYEATAVEFPDGRFVTSGFGSHLGKKLLEDETSLGFALSVRLDDLRFVARQLDQLNRSAHGPFSGKLDMKRMAIAGHSMGGLAVSLAVDQEARYKAGLIIDVHDGYVPDGVVGTTRAPVFIMASGREHWTENECKLWNNLRGPHFAVNFEGSEHLTSSDAVWLAKGAVKTGTMGPDKTIAAMREYIAAFLDANLREVPLDDPRLTSPSRDYPDAVVMSPGRPLCTQEGTHTKTAPPAGNR